MCRDSAVVNRSVGRRYFLPSRWKNLTEVSWPPCCGSAASILPRWHCSLNPSFWYFFLILFLTNRICTWQEVTGHLNGTEKRMIRFKKWFSSVHSLEKFLSEWLVWNDQTRLVWMTRTPGKKQQQTDNRSFSFSSWHNLMKLQPCSCLLTWLGGVNLVSFFFMTWRRNAASLVSLSTNLA